MKTRTSTARSTAFVGAAKSQSGEMSTIKDSNDEDLIPSGSAIVVSSLATSTAARTRINNIAARARSNVIEGRQRINVGRANGRGTRRDGEIE
jgi:hypothetical protein